MGIKKSEVTKGLIQELLIEFDDSDIIDMFEKKIDNIISKEYTDGRPIKIIFDETISDLFDESMLEKIAEIYSSVGWDVHVDYNDCVITLI